MHDHQPVGNFDDVFRQACDDAYAPFLDFLERHPAVRIALHTSGPLLQWLALHRGGYLVQLRRLVDRGQIELWGGAFFEPILPAIPERDRRGQIQAMADWLELELGRRPRGLWLAERVWEPGLASSLAGAGVAYTAVDDAHFMAAGLERDDLWGYFLTEDQGQSLAVFPIHRDLRYLIPFGEPAEVVERLAAVAAGGPGRIAVLGDDGEKFGVWPGTRARCYDERWLERFAAALAAHPWIEVRTPAEAVAHHPARGLVYLPTASYHEMQAWSLPPAAQARHHAAAARLAEGAGEDAADLLRGGHWRTFLARYPESNRLHKRMLRVSSRLGPAREDDAGWRQTRTHLWRAQCNCPYWHGVFGGLYLPHLRAALYQDLIAAESALAPPGVRTETGDVDLDGYEDGVLETPAWAAWVSARGGRLWALDDRETLWNYGDTLARRPEFYHERLREAAVGGGEGRSIHDAIRLKEPGLAGLLDAYDPHGRDGFVTRWEDDAGAVDWAEERFALAAEPAAIELAAATAGLALRQRYAARRDGALEVVVELAATAPRAGRVTITWNLGLHVARADDRWVEVNARRAEPPHWGAVARDAEVTQAAFVDAWAQRRLDVRVDRPATLERAPIETVSLSEAGAERVFQGVETRWTFTAAPAPGQPWRVTFTVVPGRAAGRS